MEPTNEELTNGLREAAKERQLEVAKQILAWIGWQALMMLGVSNKVADRNNISFKLGRNPKGVTHVKIELNGSDLYDVTFYRVRARKVTELGRKDNVYGDSLRALLAAETGLYISL